LCLKVTNERPYARGPQEEYMAKGQQRSNREKKKPKADKNKKKNAAPASLFASARGPGQLAYGQTGKKAP
jgi:hypothetical protein